MERIEVITGVQRRRRYSAQEKAFMVAECEQPGMSVSLVARRHGISASLLFRWKKLMKDGGMSAIESGDEVVSASELKALNKKVRELERMLGRKTMEAEILREALEVAQSKKLISRMPLLPPDDTTLKWVAEVLKVSCSNLLDRLHGRQKGRSPRYNKQDYDRHLPFIRELCDARAANGYRRITARQNRLLAANDERVNHKRVYRLMKQDGLLLPRYTGRPQERCHNGQVITLKPDLRWCSDGFEIRCWNKEVVRVAFSLDCCDRELMRYVATTGGITGEMVQDLLLESLEYRFGQSERVPHPLEWLTDNGSCYIAKETRSFASSLGFVVCTTPVRSPQSNAMAEAFVKTFKRDYVYLNDLPDAATVMTRLPEWIEDYNRSHPHKGLKMKSPWEYRAELASNE